jgi:hypothetical protein
MIRAPSFRWFCVSSGAIAAIALIVPWATYNFIGIEAAAHVMRFAIWPLIACFLVLVIALVKERLKALWLIIPVAVTLVWPLCVGFIYAP